MDILKVFFIFLTIIACHLTYVVSESQETFLASTIFFLPLITEAQTFLQSDQPVVSPNGKNIAWTVREKPSQVYFDRLEEENSLSVPSMVKGSKIFIKEGDCPPIEISVFEKSCWGASWSPDGNYIAYYSDAEGDVHLWVYDMKKKTSKKAASQPLSFTFPIQKLLWAPDNQEIYALSPSKHTLENETVSPSHSSVSHYKYEVVDPDKNNPSLHSSDLISYPSDLIAINFKSEESRTLLKSDESLKPWIFSISPNGRWVSYTAVQSSKDPSSKVHGNFVGINVMSTNGKIRLSLAESLPINYGKVAKYLWHPSLDRLYFLANRQVWTAEFSEEGQISCRPIDGFDGNIDSSTLAFTRDEKFLIVGLDEVDAHDYSGYHATKLALVSIDEEKSLKIFTLPENIIFTQLISNNAGICWQPDLESVSFIAKNRENCTFKSILQINLKTGKTKILSKSQSNIKPVDFNKNHQTLYAFYEDFKTPEDIFTYDEQFSHAKAVSKITPTYDSIDVGTYELFETMVPEANGQLKKIQTAIVLPPGAKRGDKLPAIVVNYPGADLSVNIVNFGGGDACGGIPQWLLTNHGFAVILPNLVLGEEAVGKPLQAMTDSLLPQIYQASNLGYIDLSRVGIIGQSYGGYGAAGIISCTNIFRAAVATNGLYDLASISHQLGSKGENYWMTWAELSQGNMGQQLFDDPQRYIDNSPFYRADKIFTPLLLIHGGTDDAYADAGKMFSALRRLNRPVEIVIYHKGYHLISEMQRDDHLDAAERILDYFHHHLDGPA